jgi:hypothetical protein
VAREAILAHLAGQAWIRSGATMPVFGVLFFARGICRRLADAMRCDIIASESEFLTHSLRGLTQAAIVYFCCVLCATLDAAFLYTFLWLAVEAHQLIGPLIAQAPIPLRYVAFAFEALFSISALAAVGIHLVSESLTALRHLRARK